MRLRLRCSDLRVASSGSRRGRICRDGVGRCDVGRRHSQASEARVVVVVGGAGSDGGGKFVGVSETGLASIAQLLDLHVEMSKMLIHKNLSLMRQSDLLLSKLVSLRIVVTDGVSQGLLAREGCMAAI